MGKAAAPHRMAAGVLIQSVANWSADKTLNHAVATQMLDLWGRVVQLRAQHPDDKMVFEVWLQEWDVPGQAGTGRMVHDNAHNINAIDNTPFFIETIWMLPGMLPRPPLVSGEAVAQTLMDPVRQFVMGRPMSMAAKKPASVG